VSLNLTTINLQKGVDMAANVQIITPSPKTHYPIIDPVCKFNSVYIHFCFGVNSGGDSTVSWGFDKKKLGSASIYHDQLMEFSFKFPPGQYVFWVECNVGGSVTRKTASFFVG
jgi:hypothetical protein